MHKRAILGVVLLCLSGCGFHLRGLDRTREIPAWLNNIAIVLENASRDLEPLLKDQLHAYHVVVSPTKVKAQYWLTIEKDTFSKQLTNVSASTTPRQYLLFYTVQFTLEKSNGLTVLPSNTITINRQFTLNNDRILGSDYEEMAFKREMEREAARQIISRLSAAHQVN